MNSVRNFGPTTPSSRVVYPPVGVLAGGRRGRGDHLVLGVRLRKPRDDGAARDKGEEGVTRDDHAALEPTRDHVLAMVDFPAPGGPVTTMRSVTPANLEPSRRPGSAIFGGASLRVGPVNP